MKVKFIALLIALVSNVIDAQAKEGFSFYQQDGLWGVLYNGEPCLLPRFESVAEIDYGGRFFYKENGKWGIANLWNKVSEAFCDSIIRVYNRSNDQESFYRYDSIDSYAPFFYSTYLFSIGGKWGICAMDGKEIVPPIYDNINIEKAYYPSNLGIKTSLWIYYYLATKDGVPQLIDELGNTVIPNVISYDYFYSKNGLKDLAKAVKKEESERLKSATANGLKNKLDEVKEYCKIVSSANTLLRSTSRSDMSIPREIWFGSKNREAINPYGDEVYIDGLKSITNSYGFISTPLVYDSPAFRVQRNPTDVYAYMAIEKKNEIHLLYFGGPNKYYLNDEYVVNGEAEKNMEALARRIAVYKELEIMARQINDMEAYKMVSNEREDAEIKLAHYKDALSRTTKLMRFNASVDRFSNTATSILNSMTNAYGSLSSSSNYSYSNSSTANSSGSKHVSGNQSMTMSDQMNYNSLRNTYNKWASDLMQMKNANGRYLNGYSINDKKHAQSEMKRLRNEAMNKWGKEIPYNSIENW